jgi:ubiquinone/menaquinone biosynthesis C-methylase UbiE
MRAMLRERSWLVDRWLPADAGRLLDAGCARGDETAIYAQRAAYTAGIEFNPEEVLAGRERHPALELKEAACEAIPFPDQSFDTAICADVLEHVQDEVRSLAELRRVLTPGGLLILTTPHRGWFDVLDPVNYPRRFAPRLWRLSPRLYDVIEQRTRDLAPRGRAGSDREAEHRHYRVDDLEDLLKQAGWDLDGAVERVFRGGGLLYVAWQNVAYFSALVLRPYPRLHRLVLNLGSMIGHLDYRTSWGGASFNVALLVRRR